jgi:hypothetical protein
MVSGLCQGAPCRRDVDFRAAVDRGIEVDLMPMDSRVLGFANLWYPLAVETELVARGTSW